MKILFFILCLSVTHSTFANCKSWSEAKKIGEFDPEIINEESGMQYVRQGKSEFLFNNNDSGDGPYIYRTNLNGNNLKKIEINGMRPFDTEAMSLGKCPGDKEQCLYLADIGDNKKIRPNISLVVLKLSDLDKDIVNPLQITSFHLPRRYNAESLAVHPNGEIFLLTKDLGHSVIFKINLGKNIQIREVGHINFSTIPGLSEETKATDMAISPSGENFVILTYDDIIYFNTDISRLNYKSNLENAASPLHAEKLVHQESITFSSDNQLIYSTEAKEGTAPIYQISCE